MNYKLCTRCVMDSTDPLISFNEKGYCNHCQEFISRTSKLSYQGISSDISFAEIIAKIKKKGHKKEYDCVIGISGGIDSSFVLYTALNQGLHPLIIHLDNGWNSEIADQNLEAITKKLGVSYQRIKLFSEDFKALQIAFLKASVKDIELPTDVAILGVLHQIAADNNIKYIISGGNFATEGILPKSWGYNGKDLKFFNAIKNKFSSREIKKFPTFEFIKEFKYKYFKGIRMIYLLNYIPYDKNRAMQVLNEKFDWNYYGGKHYESRYTGFLQAYILPTKFNIDYRRATFSTLICAGEMDRDLAIKELEKPSYQVANIEEEMLYISSKLGISIEEFKAILALPPKHVSDYPNNKNILEFLYASYWAVKKIRSKFKKKRHS
jgi:N-acetyl sugar amidotransferase